MEIWLLLLLSTMVYAKQICITMSVQQWPYVYFIELLKHRQTVDTRIKLPAKIPRPILGQWLPTSFCFWGSCSAFKSLWNLAGRTMSYDVVTNMMVHHNVTKLDLCWKLLDVSTKPVKQIWPCWALRIYKCAIYDLLTKLSYDLVALTVACLWNSSLCLKRMQYRIEFWAGLH